MKILVKKGTTSVIQSIYITDTSNNALSGISFDSGGLSLKPPVHMETMKEDMSGAAAVIATMEAIAQLKPDVNVIGITPLAENMPSGKASHPGDIVRFYNGLQTEWTQLSSISNCAFNHFPYSVFHRSYCQECFKCYKNK